MKGRVYKIDCWELLKMLPDKSVDLVVTDPPYESLEVHRSVGTTTRLMTDWFKVIKNKVLPKLLSECYRVLKDDRHCYLFCDERTSHEIKHLEFVRKEDNTLETARYGAPMMRSGFIYWKEIVWGKSSRGKPHKIDGGMGYHWKASNERIMFMEKGKRKLTNLSYPDTLIFPRLRGAMLPTAKNPDLIELLIENSCPEGGMVLDPFAGTGSTGIAAERMNRKYILGDITLKHLMYPELKEAVQ